MRSEVQKQRAASTSGNERQKRAAEAISLGSARLCGRLGRWLVFRITWLGGMLRRRLGLGSARHGGMLRCWLVLGSASNQILRRVQVGGNIGWCFRLCPVFGIIDSIAFRMAVWQHWQCWQWWLWHGRCLLR
jgi:hypothetical protein